MMGMLMGGLGGLFAQGVPGPFLGVVTELVVLLEGLVVSDY